MMNYLSAAKALDELMLALVENGIGIPAHAADGLKSGRSLASICARKPDDGDISMKTMIALENVEMNLLSLAQAHFGKESADAWQRKIGEAYREQAEPAAQSSSFVSGVPKSAYWVRIRAEDLAAVPDAGAMLGSFALAALAQDDGYTLIHGRKEDVTAFLREIREIIKPSGMERCDKNAAIRVNGSQG